MYIIYKLIKIINSLIYLIIICICCHLSANSIEQNTIRLAYYENSPPLSFIENNKPLGVFFDITNLVLGKMMGYKFIQDSFPWERAQEFVRQGTYNAHITLQTEERDKFLIFQKGYTIKSHVYLAYSKNNPRINEIKKIKNKSDFERFEMVGYIGNGWFKEKFKNNKNLNIKLVSSQINALKMINANRADLYTSSNILDALYIVRKEHLNNIVIKKINFLNPPITLYKFALRKDFPRAQNIIDNYDKNISLAMKQGLIDKIIKKYEK